MAFSGPAPDDGAFSLIAGRLRRLSSPLAGHYRFRMVRPVADDRSERLREALRREVPELRLIDTFAAAVPHFFAAGMRAARSTLPHWLDGLGGTSRRAALAALTAQLCQQGKCMRIEAGNGAIHLPRPHPHIVFLDVDGTLTDVPSPWRHLHMSFDLWRGTGEAILRRWLSGEIDYDRFCAEDVGLWQRAGISCETVCTLLDAIPVRPQAITLLRRLEALGVGIVLVSSGFTRVARRIVHAARLEGRVRIIANELYRRLDGSPAVTVNVSGDRRSRRSKGQHVRRVCREYGISPIAAAGIGDGPSDRDLFDRCGQALLLERPEELDDVPRRIGLAP